MTVDAEYDVAILGAGPAGAAAALALADTHRVAVFDAVGAPTDRVGESLVPAARALLRDLGVLDAFEAEGYPAYHGNRSFWGSSVAHESDFLRDPDGPGWHLDRPGFERFLRARAIGRGASIVAPMRVARLERRVGGWRIHFDERAGRDTVDARFLIDASGRRVVSQRATGAEPIRSDRLVAAWLRGRTCDTRGAHAGWSEIESAPDGWWYTAPVVSEGRRARRVLAFHSDADLIGDVARDSTALLTKARSSPAIGALLDAVGFEPDGTGGGAAADSSHLSVVAESDWLAVGDAALGFDPLSSQGLFNALYTGLRGAESCARRLRGEVSDCRDYVERIRRIRSEFERHRAVAYASEARWSTHPFWARRHARGAAG